MGDVDGDGAEDLGGRDDGSRGSPWGSPRRGPWELRARREDLRLLLEERFGTLPPALIVRVEAAEDLERLRTALRQTVHLTSLDDLTL